MSYHFQSVKLIVIILIPIIHKSQERVRISYFAPVCLVVLVYCVNTFLHFTHSEPFNHGQSFRYHAAIEFYKESRPLTLVKVVENLTSSRQDSTSMSIYNLLALVYFLVGYYDESKANDKLALQIRNKTVEDKNKELQSYDILFAVAVALCRYDKAIKYLEKALQISREAGNAEKEAEIYRNLGRSHQALGQNEKAMAYQLKSLKLSKEIGDRKTEAKYAKIAKTLEETIRRKRKSHEN